MISAGSSATPEQLAAWRSRNGPPENEAGVALAWSGILGRGPDLVVALTGAAVFSTGVRLDVAVRARTGHDHRLVDTVLGDAPASDRLLLGVELADGRVATTGWPPADLAADAASLVPGGGEGGDRSVDIHLYLHPLPPLGPVAIVCTWPGRGIAETRTEFTGAVEAATGVVRLWPPQPPATHDPAPPARVLGG